MTAAAAPRLIARLAVLAWMAVAPLPAAAMGAQPGSAQVPPWAVEALAKAKQQIDAGNYEAALGDLDAVIQADPKNPDVLTYIAYANRKLGNLDVAQQTYEKALAIDPQNRGANEYLGELHLVRGDLAGARARLEALDTACLFGCAEYDQLKQRIADFEAGRFDPSAK